MCISRISVSPVSKERLLESLLERRKYVRFPGQFRIRVTIERTSGEVEGLSRNLCQGGLFFLTPSLGAFREHDPTIIHLYLPPEMTGHQHSVVLQGQGTVRRIDEARKGVAIEFSRLLRSFPVSR